MQNVSRSVVVASLVAVLALITAAVLFISGDAAMERLALLIAFAGTIVPGLVAALRSDQAAKSTNDVSHIAQALNGGFEARVRNANRATASETGTPDDAARAYHDAIVSAELSTKITDTTHAAPVIPLAPPPVTPPATGDK